MLIICAVKNSLKRLEISLQNAAKSGDFKASAEDKILILQELIALKNAATTEGEICIFTSPAGAEFGAKAGQIALAVGQKTAAALAERSVRVLAVSKNSHASGLLALIAAQFAGKKFVYLRPKCASCDITAALRAQNIACRDEIIYENRALGRPLSLPLAPTGGAEMGDSLGAADATGGAEMGDISARAKWGARGEKTEVVLSSPSLARCFYLYMQNFSTNLPRANGAAKPEKVQKFCAKKLPFCAFCIGKSTQKTASALFDEVYALQSGCSYEEIFRLRRQIREQKFSKTQAN